jgi:hypothetical protein
MRGSIIVFRLVARREKAIKQVLGTKVRMQSKSPQTFIQNAKFAEEFAKDSSLKNSVAIRST